MQSVETYLRGTAAALDSITSHRRKLDDVAYWRKQAGWYDDDESMKNYNSGTMQYGDDDYTPSSTSSSSSSSGGFGLGDTMTTMMQIGGAFVAMAIVINIIKALGKRKRKTKSRGYRGKNSDDRSRKSSKSNKSGRSSRSKSRTRSSSKSRSRSKSRKGDDNYHLMDDARSHKSGRSSKSSKSAKSKSSRKSSSSKKIDTAVLV